MVRLLSILAFAALSLGAVAQDPDSTIIRPATKTRKDPRPIADRLWFGGGIGLSFGTVTAIQLDPMVGYKVDQEGKLSAGLGLSYWYYQDNRYTPSYNATGYGYRVLSRYRFIEQLYGHVEFLHMNVETFDPIRDIPTRRWVPHLLVGGGFVQSLGGNGSFYFQVLFDVWQDPYSIYANQGAIFGVGVGIGF